MLRATALACAVMLVSAHSASGQASDAAADLVSSWLLVTAERDIASGQPRRIPGARGLLVLDGAGNVFEFFVTPSETSPQTAPDPRRIFADNGGFWGRYDASTADGRIDFAAEEGVSPSVRGLKFSRRYELVDDRLVITSTHEPQAQRDIRLTWRRVPTVEHLSPAYREVVGFWRHIEEQRVDTATGEVETTRERAPSVIVYTPGGFVGVHFPTLARAPFAAEAPTEEEAQAARNYLGYYGALGVYPGEVFHNVLGGVSPSAGAILRRYAEIKGDELVVTIPSGNPQSTLATTVHLRRLSGADDMLPRVR
jgi:hypothetical protein